MKSTSWSFVATNEKRVVRGPMNDCSQRGHRVAADEWMVDSGKTASHEGQEIVRASPPTRVNPLSNSALLRNAAWRGGAGPSFFRLPLSTQRRRREVGEGAGGVRRPPKRPISRGQRVRPGTTRFHPEKPNVMSCLKMANKKSCKIRPTFNKNRDE
jgi:hypothetical protein